MVDRHTVRRRARPPVRQGAEQITDPPTRDHRSAPSDVGSVLEIIHAQYHRELARAAGGDPAEPAGALAEARRLVRLAVALRGGVATREVDHIPRVQAKRQGPELHGRW
jgi:hypothetical protein